MMCNNVISYKRVYTTGQRKQQVRERFTQERTEKLGLEGRMGSHRVEKKEEKNSGGGNSMSKRSGTFLLQEAAR